MLPPRIAGTGVLLLRSQPDQIRIACDACGRARRYRRDGLIERFGPDAGMPDVVWALAADCPRLTAPERGRPCQARHVER